MIRSSHPTPTAKTLPSFLQMSWQGRVLRRETEDNKGCGDTSGEPLSCIKSGNKENLEVLVGKFYKWALESSMICTAGKEVDVSVVYQRS